MLHFGHFPEKDDPYSLFVSEATACEKPGWIYEEKSCFRLPFQKEHGKPVSTLLKPEQEHLQHNYCSMGRQFSCKKSPLVIWKTLRVFVNTMTAVDKCSPPNRENLMQPIHIEFSQKVKTFCSFILHFRNLG